MEESDEEFEEVEETGKGAEMRQWRTICRANAGIMRLLAGMVGGEDEEWEDEEEEEKGVVQDAVDKSGLIQIVQKHAE